MSRKSYNYVLSVSYDDIGAMLPEIRVVNSRSNRLFSLFPNRMKLPEYVYERIAFTKILRGIREEGEFGWWIGPNHMLVRLSKDEYNDLQTLVEPNKVKANVNARKQSKDSR
jgi:hypothetical protein